MLSGRLLFLNEFILNIKIGIQIMLVGIYYKDSSIDIILIRIDHLKLYVFYP